MEIILPSSFTLTFGAVVLFFSLLGGAIRAYVKLSNGINSRLAHLETKIDDMVSRNARADEETAMVKNEQATQRTTIAVMAEQMQGITRTLERIDGNVNDLVKRSMAK